MLNNSKTSIADSLYVYNEAAESLIDVNGSLNNTGSAIDQEILNRKTDTVAINNTFLSKLNTTIYNAKILEIGSNLLTKLNISDFNITNTTNLNLINVKVNTNYINNTLTNKLNIADFNNTNTTNLNLTNLKVHTSDINSTLTSKLNVSDFDNFKISNNSELNAKQGVFTCIPPIYFSANFESTRMDMILSEEEISQMTFFYNKTNIDTLTTDNNATLSNLLTNINSQVLTTDYNLNVADINTSLGSKLNISDNNATLSNLRTNINSRVLTTDYNLKVAEMNISLGSKVNSSQILNYDATINRNSKLAYKLDVSIMNNTKEINLSGLSLFNFTTYVNAITSYVDILKFDIDNLQANAYTTHTTFINECIINDGIHIHDYIHLLHTSYLKFDTVNILCTQLSYLQNSTSNIQTQLNNIDATITSNSKLAKQLDVDIYGTTITINITGNGALCVFQSNKVPELSYEMMSLDVENISGSNYTNNTILLQRCNINNLWVNDKIFIHNNSVIYSNGLTISPTEISYLDGVTSNLQTQLNNKLDVEVYPTAKTVNLSGVSLFNIKSYKDAMTSYVDLLNFDVINSYGYGTNTTIIENLANINDVIIMGNAQFQIISNIYTSSKLNQNYITTRELYNLKSSNSNLQTQINARISSATWSSTLTSYDTVSNVNTKIEGTKPWVCGRLFAAGSISNNACAQNALVNANINNSSAGTYVFTIPTHPNGGNYNVFITHSTSGGGTFFYSSNVNSSTSFKKKIYIYIIVQGL